MDPATVLTALAELTPANHRRDWRLDATGGRSLVWLANPARARSSRAAKRLAAMDVLHRDERLLRRGWVFLLGIAQADGRKRKVRLPLLSEPVRMRRVRGGYRIVSAGDLELTPLVSDREIAATLESAAGAGTASWARDPATADWVREAAQAIGLPVTEVRLATPDRVRGPAKTLWPPEPPSDRLLGVAGAALYAVRDGHRGGIRETLLNWSSRPGLAQTALAAIYHRPDREPEAVEPADDDQDVLSPLPLNPAQTEVVRRARTEPVTVVSGPPGSGKSHAVVAAALDAVDRGGSVLLVTQSAHAADVLGDLLDRYPGPTPVLFGDAERRKNIAAKLAAGTGQGYPERTLRADQAAVAAAQARVRQLTAAVDAALELEERAAELTRWAPLVPALQAVAPGAFQPGTDLDRAAELADSLRSPAENWWRQLCRRRADRRFRAILGAGPRVPDGKLLAAIAAGRAIQSAAKLAATGGTELGPAWYTLHAAAAELAATVGTAMRHRAASSARWGRAARAGVASLANALRAGRNRRRELLAGMDGAALVRALPLWVGTASDAEDLLPPVPGLFDLVILDEASHLDQLQAAPVLARAGRAVVVGDPRQLRFVSFVAEADVSATLRRHRLDDRADVRRMSAFDLAAATAPVTWLDQHYRSMPHLIDFSARKFYQGRLTVATRHPTNDAADVIDVIRVPDGEVIRGVNNAEVEAVVAAVRELAGRGTAGIAVISPFRAQADALEAALVRSFSVTEMERHQLRVGTVHAFQGSEAHTVVASLGLVDHDASARMRFVADPSLFNVLVTRARERMLMVTSLRHDIGLIGEYLTFSEAGPQPPGDTPTSHEWTTALADELRRVGQSVRRGYPVGPWRIDICLGDGAAAVGLVTRVHLDGRSAHRQRQRALIRAGWRLVDAYPSRWSSDPVRAAVELAARMKP